MYIEHSLKCTYRLAKRVGAVPSLLLETYGVHETRQVFTVVVIKGGYLATCSIVVLATIRWHWKRKR